MPDGPEALYFRLFNEIGIIEQISRAFLEARLPHGLIQPHFTVVNHLVRVADGQTPLDLAAAFQVPKTSMTHTLQGLEKHRLVEMRPNPDDGRSKRVWLTEKGRAFREQAIEDLTPVLQEIAGALPPDRLAVVLPALEELRVFMDRQRNRRT